MAEDGREMHKSWGNAIWFDDAAETMGADVIRWIAASNKPENNLLFGYNRAEEVKRLFFMTLLNVYNFFYQYATLDGWTPDQQPSSLSNLDRWILGRLAETLERVTKSLDNYQAHLACTEIDRFVDVLSKWYVRRSRRRFWKTEKDEEKKAAYSTLYTCLKNLALMLAPITPFLSEAIYQRLVRPVEPDAPLSVHHCRWPEPDRGVASRELMEEMNLALELSGAGRSARSQAGIKLRQPLSKVVVVSPPEQAERVRRVAEIIQEELNVKALEVVEDRSKLLSLRIKPIPRSLGRKYGRSYPKLAEALGNLGENEVAKLARGEPVMVQVDGEAFKVEPEDVEVVEEALEGYSVAEAGEFLVGVCVVIDEDLRDEGLARDLVRRIQALRKEAGFEIDNRIRVYYEGDSQIARVFEKHREYIMTETLSEEVVPRAPRDELTGKPYNVDGLKVTLWVEKVDHPEPPE